MIGRRRKPDADPADADPDVAGTHLAGTDLAGTAAAVDTDPPPVDDDWVGEEWDFEGFDSSFHDGAGGVDEIEGADLSRAARTRTSFPPGFGTGGGYEEDAQFDRWYEGDSGGASRRGRRSRRGEPVYTEDVFPSRGRGRGLLVFLVVCIIIAAGALYGVRWTQRQLDPPGPPGAPVVVDITRGSSTSQIGSVLQRHAVITNARLFRYYAQVKGKGGFQAGTYTFNLNSSFNDVLTVLARGPAAPEQHKVTIPEGFRLSQIADRLASLPSATAGAASGFLDLAKSGRVKSNYQPPGSTNLEGLLFPDTYTFADDDTPQTMLQRMVDEFDQVADGEGVGDAKRLVGVSPYQAIIVASLVEREAKTDADRGPIARVIYNRLAKGQPLQIDATVVYALGGNVDRVLSKDLGVKSPYNTYTVKGLPPTPIAVPGKASIEAALHPTPGAWLYYVVTGADGSHSFATTYAQHQRNIALASRAGCGSAMTLTGSTRLAAVIGAPVRHSLSPVLHNAAFAALGLDWVYVALPVEAGQAAAALAGMRALGIGGLSVTMPHKSDVAAAVDEASDDVIALGAANTVVPVAGGLRGESTDGDGFLAALREQGFDPAGERCLVVGAGGAGRAVVLALGRAGAREVVVVNRDGTRAAAAVALVPGVARVGDAAEADTCALVVNATPLGMGADTALPVDVSRLGPGQVVNDLVYHPAVTPLLAEAARRGSTALGGLGMLLHQAARQLTLWTGEAAPIAAMRNAVEAELRRRAEPRG